MGRKEKTKRCLKTRGQMNRQKESARRLLDRLALRRFQELLQNKQAAPKPNNIVTPDGTHVKFEFVGEEGDGKEGENCLICLENNGRESKSQTSTPLLGTVPLYLAPVCRLPTELNQNLGMVLFLRKALNLSLEDLTTFMEDSGGLSPKDWFPMCAKCMYLVHQIAVVSEEAKKLQEVVNQCAGVILDIWSQSEVKQETQDDLLDVRRARIRKVILERNKKSEEPQFVQATSSSVEVLDSDFHVSLPSPSPPPPPVALAPVLQVKRKRKQEVIHLTCPEENATNSSNSSQSVIISLSSNLSSNSMERVEKAPGISPAKIKTPPKKIPTMSMIWKQKITLEQGNKNSDLPGESTKSPGTSGRKEKAKDDIKGAGSGPNYAPASKEKPILEKWLRLYTCDSCPALMPMDFDRLLAHIIFHWKRPNKCTECSEYLPPEEDLTANHWNEFHSAVEISPSTPKYLEVHAAPVDCWKCGESECTEKFSCYSLRDKHEKEMHSFLAETPESCKECAMKFRNTQEIRLHLALEHPESASLNCSFCLEFFGVESETKSDLKFRDWDALQSHILTAHPEETFRKANLSNPRKTFKTHALILLDCPVCGLVFKVTRGLAVEEHVKNHHSHSPSDLRGRPSRRKFFHCVICQKDIACTGTWTHFNRFHYKPSVCEICGEKVSPKELPTHLAKKHNTAMEGGTLHRCFFPGCDFKSHSVKPLRKHISHHEKDRSRPYQCQYCGKAFMCSSHRRTHENIHLNKESKPHQCDICGNSFAVRNYLYIHKRLSHLGQKFPSTNRKRPGQSKKRNGKINIASAKSAIASAPTPTTTDPDNIPGPPVQAEKDVNIAHV